MCPASHEKKGRAGPVALFENDCPDRIAAVYCAPTDANRDVGRTGENVLQKLVKISVQG
jgi:hypothetical protein